MNKPKPPREPYFWEMPGFKFVTTEMKAWLGGWEPTIAPEMVKSSKGKPVDPEAIARLKAGRSKGAKAGKKVFEAAARRSTKKGAP